MRPFPRALVLTLALAGAALAGQPERLLVGVIVDADETGALELLRDGKDYLVPLDAFADLVGFGIDEDDQGIRVQTPLGDASLTAADMRVVDGQTYVPRAALESTLAARIEFDPAEFALRVRVPWQGVSSTARADPELPQAVRAPHGNLLGLRGDFGLSRTETGDGAFGSFELNGGAGGGFWRARYSDDFEGQRYLESYSWYRRVDRTLLLVGRQSIQTHPVLEGFEMTGVQMAWTNQPVEMFARQAGDRELLPRRIRPTQSYRGEAPPGSIARLEVDGVVLDQQRVGLDGHYEFTEIELSVRRATRVEVALYDLQATATPIEVHEYRTLASDQLLEPRAAVHLGGVGHAGDLARVWSGRDERKGAAGFYHWRQGISERWTLEAGTQIDESRTQLSAGFVTRLADTWIASAAVAASDGVAGYDAALEGYGSRWNLRATSYRKGSGFASDGAAARSDHLLESWFEPQRTLSVGLVGRMKDEAGGRIAFLRPALTLRARSGLHLRVRPDHAGDYDAYATYRISARDRVNASSNETVAVDWVRRIGDRDRLSVGSELVPGAPDRVSVLYGRAPRTRRGLQWGLGLIRRGTKTGGFGSASLTVAPGVLARAEYQGVPLSSIDSAVSDRFQLSFNVDLAWVAGRIVPGDGLAPQRARGAIAGRVLVDSGGEFPLHGIPVLIDGRKRGVTDASGRYYVSNLEPAVYNVDIGDESLPIELTRETVATHVQVSPGIATIVDFALAVEYGIAGRLTDEHGVQMADRLVELDDVATGRVIGTARTDEYGLYRIDGIPPGSYRLRAMGLAAPTREVTVTDEFLFEQDLVIPGSDGPARVAVR